MILNDRSVKSLTGVHPSLVKVIMKTAELVEENSEMKFIVTEGLRTVERQKKLVAEGKSKTMNSRHITGHAVDLAVWFDFDKDKVVDADELSWKFPHYKQLSDIVKEAAKQVGVKITWGGDWTSFKDGPHFEIDPNIYKWKIEGK